MEATPAAALAGTPVDAAQLAKATLRRLALSQLEPTPENYARAWRQESGEPPAATNDGPAIAGLIERIVRGLERSSRGWTAARKKESLQRVLDGSRADLRRLQQRLTQLVASWDDAGAAAHDEPEATDEEGVVEVVAPIVAAPEATPEAEADARVPTLPPIWGRAVGALGSTVQTALRAPADLAADIGARVREIVKQGPSEARVAELERCCGEAAPVLEHRHRLLEQLNGLCVELTTSLADLAEDESWARGQCEAMRVKLDEGLTARGIRAVAELLRDTRERQNTLRGERERARDSLKSLIGRMLDELGELGSRTGQFHESVGRYADVIERADTLESLTGAVREMVEESRTVQELVQQTQARLSAEHHRTLGLSRRVLELEGEMERLSSEVATDQLTQIANRRGLQQAFETERRRLGDAGAEEKAPAGMAVGLLDIDNFKRLNDELGHAAGDTALRSLAALVARNLRPGDHVARYGGEEFVVLLPATAVDDGRRILTELQRSLTGGLFLHESRQVFVTFSAGVTAYRASEPIEEALERADRALYEAKRTGKNRTCVA